MPGYIVVAEKPSVARAIAQTLKGRAIVISVRGHVYNADLPAEFRYWSINTVVPILSVRKLQNIISDRAAYTEVRTTVKNHPDKTLVVASDHDFEGELIGDEIVRIYRSVRGPSAQYMRMNFNSTAPDEIENSWGHLAKSLNYGWVDKARFRQTFDLLTGAAFTRLLTLGVQGKGRRQLISWGSCQVPTLYFVVQREKEILAFKPEKYWILRALLETEKEEKFEASTAHIDTAAEAKRIYDKVKNAKEGTVSEYSETLRIIPRPYPVRTDDALRDLTKITGLSAAQLLTVLEKLYSAGQLSYIRTDTNQYASNFDFDKPRKAALGSGIFGGIQMPPRATPRNGALNDGSHPPIYPVRPYDGTDSVEKKVWEYVARRFIANAYMTDAKRVDQGIETAIEGVPFVSAGGYLSDLGFFKVYSYFQPSDNRLPKLVLGENVKVLSFELSEEETKPPARLTEAELLRLLERFGIGTDATRSSFPSLIIRRGYATKIEKRFKPTGLGMALIDALLDTDPKLATPDTRKLVEEKMKAIESRAAGFDTTLDEVTELYRGLLVKCKDRLDSISGQLAHPGVAGRLRADGVGRGAGLHGAAALGWGGRKES